jgi:hypothetical protein
MRTISEAWREVIGSADITYRETATLLDESGQPTGPDLDVVSGSMTEDSTAQVRHDFALTVADPDGELRPTDPADLLMPFATRVRISRGLRHVDGTWEDITTIIGRVDETRFRLGEGTVSMSGLDRSALLQEGSPVPARILAGRNAATAIRDLLWVKDPTIEFDLMVTDWTFPQLSFPVDTDLLAEAVKNAATIGAEVFCTRDDRIALQPIPTATGPAVCRFVEGENSTVLGGDQAWKSYRVPNGVIVTGQHSSMSSPVRAEVRDEDPNSPTYWKGPYGYHPKFVTSERITTAGQALAMARGELERRLGGAHEIELSVIPDPSVEAGDVADVSIPSLGVEGLFVVSRVSLSFGDPSAEMGVTLRSGVVE